MRDKYPQKRVESAHSFCKFQKSDTSGYLSHVSIHWSHGSQKLLFYKMLQCLGWLAKKCSRSTYQYTSQRNISKLFQISWGFSNQVNFRWSKRQRIPVTKRYAVICVWPGNKICVPLLSLSLKDRKKPDVGFFFPSELRSSLSTKSWNTAWWTN